MMKAGGEKISLLVYFTHTIRGKMSKKREIVEQKCGFLLTKKKCFCKILFIDTYRLYTFVRRGKTNL